MANTLPIWVEDARGAQGTGSGEKRIFGGDDGGGGVAQVPVEALRKNLQAVSSTFLQALADIRAVGDFSLDEVKVKVEVGAEGGVHLIGSASASAKGAIELVFSKPRT